MSNTQKSDSGDSSSTAEKIKEVVETAGPIITGAITLAGIVLSIFIKKKN